ncbi:3651_t:CDS:2 [Gigaspora rosea]|nr:3651_t:CDS:2 [Gigaspora rosea]
MLEKAVGKIKRSVQVMQNSEKSRYWPREEFGRARDQFEYDEVAKKEGWNVAAGIRDPLDDDPMEVFFQERLARQSARNNRPRKNGKLKCQVCSFQMGPEKWEVWHQTRWRIGPCWVTNFLAAWPTRFCSREIPTYGSMLPYPSTYQHRYENSQRTI